MDTKKIYESLSASIVKLAARVKQLEKIPTNPQVAKIVAPAGNVRDLAFYSDGASRWVIRCTNAAESGSNAGSNLEIISRNDDGSFLTAVISINRATGFVTIVQEGWTAPTLVNSWANFGSGYNNAGYFKDSLGVVHLRGMISGGTATSGTTLFTLPSGYRPAAKELFNIQSNSALGRVDILTTGAVTIITGSNTWLSLDGITFRAA